MVKRGRAAKEQTEPEPAQAKKRLSIEEQRQRALEYRKRLAEEKAAEKEEVRNHITAPKHGRSKSPPRSVKKSRVVEAVVPSVTSDDEDAEVEDDVASSHEEDRMEDVQKVLFIDEDTRRGTRSRRRETLLLPPSPTSSPSNTLRQRRGPKNPTPAESTITRGTSRRKSLSSMPSVQADSGPFTRTTRQSLPAPKSQRGKFRRQVDEQTSSSSEDETEEVETKPPVTVAPTAVDSTETISPSAPSDSSAAVHHEESTASITITGFIMSLFFILLPAAVGYVSIAYPQVAAPVVAQLHQSHYVLKKQLETLMEKINAVFLISVAVAVISLLLYILYRVYLTYSSYKKKHDDIVLELTHAAKNVLRSKILDSGYNYYPITFVKDELIDRATHNATAIKKLWPNVEKEIAKDSRIVVVENVFEGKSRRCWCMQGISKAEPTTPAEPVGNTVSFL